MTAKEILDIVLEFAGDNWGLGLVLILCFLSLIEVTKIKINPWSKLFKWIGDLVFSGIRSEMIAMKTEMTNEISDVKADLTEVKNDLGEMKHETWEDRAKAARNRILRCSDEVYQSVRHSKEYFDNILADITFYKAYCDEHPGFQNEMTVMAVQRIEAVYKHCLENHNFL